MKTLPQSVALAVLTTVCLVFVSFEFQQDPIYPILESSGVDISSKYPYEAGFNLKKGEKIKLSVNKIGGDGQLSDLRVVIFQAGSPERILTLAQLSSYTIPQDGPYKFKLDAGNSKKTIRVSVALLSDQKPHDEILTAKDTSQISSLFIGAKSKSNAPQPEIRLDAKKGQFLTPKTNLKDQRLDFIKYQFSGDGQIYYLSDQTAHEIKTDGKVTFTFFLDQPKRKGLNMQDILSKNENGILLDNLHIHRFKPSKEVPKPSETPPKEDPGQALIERMLTDQAKMQADQARKDSLFMETLYNKGIDTMATSANPIIDPVIELIPPRASIEGDGNRPCFPLREKDILVNNPRFFAFYILTGEDAQERFGKAQEQHKIRAASQPGSFVGSLLHAYATQMVFGTEYRQIKGSTSSIPNSRNMEYVEYAIVDRANSLLFSRGENYTPYHGLSGLASSDYGNAPIPDDPANRQLFLCVCNRNFITPVSIYFTYETFAINVLNRMN